MLWALFGQGPYGKDNMKKFCKISLALAFAFARGIAIGFLGLLPGKSAINQALAAESSATDQWLLFSRGAQGAGDCLDGLAGWRQ